MLTLFFITGSGRCGSTAVYHLLKDHPDVALTNEAHVVDAIQLAGEALTLPHGDISPTRGFKGVVTAACVEDLYAAYTDSVWDILVRFYRRHFDRTFTHFGDKLPSPFAARSILDKRPETRNVIIARDPRDVVCSFEALKHRPAQRLGPDGDQLKDDGPKDFALRWRRTYECLLEAPGEPLIVRFPDILDQPRETAERILDYLHLRWHGSIEASLNSNQWLSDHSTTQRASAAVSRWTRELSPEVAADVVATCGPLMQELGLPISEG